MVLLDSSHDSWENEALLVKIGARVLNLWLDTSSGPTLHGQNVGSRPQAPSLRHLLRFCDFIGFISWFLKKMRHCLWILELGFCTYGWICFLGPSGPNLVSRPQGQDIFWDFIILLDLSDSWKNEVLFCENWSQRSWLMAWLSPLPKGFGPKLP